MYMKLSCMHLIFKSFRCAGVHTRINDFMSELLVGWKVLRFDIGPYYIIPMILSHVSGVPPPTEVQQPDNGKPHWGGGELPYISYIGMCHPIG